MRRNVKVGVSVACGAEPKDRGAAYRVGCACRRPGRSCIGVACVGKGSADCVFRAGGDVYTSGSAFEVWGECEVCAAGSISEVFDAVARGRADYGVVPVENSWEGAVNHTLDMFLESELQVCAQILLKIEQHLLAVGPREEITKIYSHPQAFWAVPALVAGEYAGRPSGWRFRVRRGLRELAGKRAGNSGGGRKTGRRVVRATDAGCGDPRSRRKYDAVFGHWTKAVAGDWV